MLMTTRSDNQKIIDDGFRSPDHLTGKAQFSERNSISTTPENLDAYRHCRRRRSTSMRSSYDSVEPLVFGCEGRVPFSWRAISAAAGGFDADAVAGAKRDILFF